MSTSYPSNLPVVDMSSVMNNLNVSGDQVISESGPPSEVVASFETLREDLASKIHGKNQTARHFAAEVESIVLTISHHYPQEMSESKVTDWKRIQF